MCYRQVAPWLIPATAHRQVQRKRGYYQLKYTWKEGQWQYVARWHSPLPTARLITYSCWRLERIHPGKGFGSTAAPRRIETWVGGRWLPLQQVRYWALKYNQGQASQREIALLKAAHPRSRRE